MRTLACSACLVAGTLVATAADMPNGHPLAAFFGPVARPNIDEMRRLDEREAIVRVLPGVDGELAVLAAAKTTADAEALAGWIRRIAELKRSEFVPAIARISDPPVLEDFRRLALDDDDLDAIRVCRPGDCDVKLTAEEIASLRRADERAADPDAALQEAFRQLVLARVRTYLAEGHAGLGPYADREHPPALDDAFAALLERSPFMRDRVPGLARFLSSYPRHPDDRIESFLYWSKERMGGRPTISVTHVAMLKPASAGPAEIVVAGKQVFATHYTNASLSVTTILRGASGTRYLAYLNRSRVDVLDRWYGGMARRVIERRVRRDAVDVFENLRQRIER
jgi:hypothetical protein